ncbi:MAG TPA: hypothetical protein PLB18_04070 [Acidobacteriota bacterium]|nr:hypothetical protein [Acidobacteriota bacterium]HNG91189.1 hypothetical protein [Acidobacteriota bacterium]HNJ42050.1 hypothetical protein [Acidobacteriota bacterium]
MASFAVNQVHLARRCEICHQSDVFDPQTETCARCARISLKNQLLSVYEPAQTPSKIVLARRAQEAKLKDRAFSTAKEAKFGSHIFSPDQPLRFGFVVTGAMHWAGLMFWVAGLALFGSGQSARVLTFLIGLVLCLGLPMVMPFVIARKHGWSWLSGHQILLTVIGSTLSLLTWVLIYVTLGRMH